MKSLSRLRMLAIAACIALVGISTPPVQAADYTKPQGAVEVFVPDHGVTIAVFAAQTGVGHVVGVFEKLSSGLYSLCFNCFTLPAYPTFQNDVSFHGGVGQYLVNSIAPQINEILQRRYPPIGGPSGNTIFDQVQDGVKNTFTLVIKSDGSPAFVPK